MEGYLLEQYIQINPAAREYFQYLAMVLVNYKLVAYPLQNVAISPTIC